MGLYRISGEALIFNNQQNRRPLLSTRSGLPVRITLWMSLADMIGSLGITVHAYFSTSDNKNTSDNKKCYIRYIIRSRHWMIVHPHHS